jgi:hypothetical protein
VLAHAGSADESLAVVMIFAALWLGWIGRSRLKGTGFPRLPRSAAWAVIGVAACVLVASAIVPRALLGPKPTSATSSTRISSTATIAFRQPPSGATVSGTQLEVVLDLEGGRVVDQTTTAITPDTGHIHLSMDGTLVSMTYGTEQLIDLTPYQPGPHTLTAEFVAADHAPFSPPVVATETFTMRGSS